VSFGRSVCDGKKVDEEAEKALLVKVLASNLITPAGKSFVKKSFAALPKSLYFSTSLIFMTTNRRVIDGGRCRGR
jgi:hypothetical protein